jgi:hypothetical protein
MISLSAERDGQSLVKTRDAAERVDILLKRASRFFGEGEYERAKEAVLSAQAVLEQQEVVSILDNLRVLIFVGRLYSACGNPVAALEIHKKVAEQMFDHTGDLDLDDPKTAALFRLHEYTLVDARLDAEEKVLGEITG